MRHALAETRRLVAGAAVLVLAASTSCGEEFAPWRIVSAADWHSAESGVLSSDPSDFAANQQAERLRIAGTVACGPDVVLIAGDVGSGHWTQSTLKRHGVLQPDETIEEAIHRLGDKTYRAMKRNFAGAGVERLWVSLGDHGIGDNDWPPGSERARCVPYHRAIFGRSYNLDDEGRRCWPEMVCGVPARPLGTRYAGTSFAVRHKNTLFVILDIFHQEGPDDRLHPRHGSVNPDLEGEHLAWFDRVLAAGRADGGIRHLFVQAHTPALPPVRGQSSSMMMADGYQESNLWRTMRKHGVDLYFAGEVHATTIRKDPQSDVVQLVTDRNMPTVITVYPDRLELQTFDRTLGEDGTARENPRHADHRVTMLKTGGKTSFAGGRGLLKPLDPDALFIHYPFEKLEPTPFGPTKFGRPTTLLNHGELNCTYDARTRKVQLVEGKLGRGLAFAPGGVVDVHGTGPFGFYDRVERTFAIWFKTSAAGRYNLVCGGSGTQHNKWGGGGFMDLALKSGALLVRTTAGDAEITAPELNDGQWHHAALVVLPNARTLADLRVYIDGAPRDWAPEVDERQAIVARMGIYGVALGGSHRPVWKDRAVNAAFVSFDGAIDDFAAWYRALSAAEVRSLHDLAVNRRIDAAGADRRFRERTGPAFLKGADISLLQAIEDRGGVYARDGVAGDPLAIFHEKGCNIMRLRLFHTPTGRPPRVNDLAYTTKLGRRIKAAGFRLLLNFHYSDTWADPGHQVKPAAWRDLDVAHLEAAVFAYSRDAVAALRRAGAMPEIVQVGNEITPGMLWDTGRVGGEHDAPAQWRQFGALLKAGIGGVRAGAGGESVLIMLQVDCGGNVEATRWFFDHVAEQGVAFDLIGLSYYPWWHSQGRGFDPLRENLAATADRYGKPIVVVETAYPWQSNNPDPTVIREAGKGRPLVPGLPPTPAGQQAFLSQLIGTVRETPNGLGRGVLYWAPEYIPGTDYDPGRNHLSLFDEQGNALPGLAAFAE